MADVTTDLRLVVFTDKTCGVCIGMKKSGILDKFAKANPGIPVVHMDHTKAKERDSWADELEEKGGLRGWPHLSICRADRHEQLAGISGAPTSLDQLNKLVTKAKSKL